MSDVDGTEPTEPTGPGAAEPGGPRFRGGVPQGPQPAPPPVTPGPVPPVPPVTGPARPGQVPPPPGSVPPGLSSAGYPDHSYTGLSSASRSGRGPLVFAGVIVLVVAGLIGFVVFRTVNAPEKGWTEMDNAARRGALEDVCSAEGRTFDDAKAYEAGADDEIGTVVLDRGGPDTAYKLVGGGSVTDDTEVGQLSLVTCISLAEETQRTECQVADGQTFEIITAGVFDLRYISLRTGEELGTDVLPIVTDGCPGTASRNLAGDVVDDYSENVRARVTQEAAGYASMFHAS